MRDSEKPLVILFGGQSREGVPLRLSGDGRRIAAVVVPERASPRLQHSVEQLRAAGLPILTCRKATVPKALASVEAEILLSVGFPYLLSEDLLRRFPVCLNVHPTLLPRYRGPTTGAYVIMNGEPYAGSTVHLIDSGMDTGAIVAQRAVPLTRFDTVRSMQRKVYAIEPDLVAAALRALEDPAFRPTPQDESQATMYPRPRTPEDSEIDPSRPLIDLFDTIRACDPDAYPAFFYVEGQKVCVRVWRPEKPNTEADLI